MANKLQGQLSEGGLASLLQYLAHNRVSGCLELTHQAVLGSPRGGRIYLESGQLVHALCADLAGVPAVSNMLGWPSGDFAFHSGMPSPQRSIQGSLDALLLEAAYRADAHAFDVALGEQSILQPLPLPSQESSVALSLGALRLLRLLDGHRTLGTVASRLGAPFEEVKKAARELLQQSLAQLLTDPLVPATFLAELTGLLIEFMGPIAEVVLDDTLFELGLSAEALPKRAVSRLIESLSGQLRHEGWRMDFAKRARALCEKYRFAT
ncbi:MAG: DUF4388 domain-containing protein [Truepera sp.]|nr:DUF4388 domain-containing protein [Truepera sp.]